jgi:hypothetical protein
MLWPISWVATSETKQVVQSDGQLVAQPLLKTTLPLRMPVKAIPFTVLVSPP